MSVNDEADDRWHWAAPKGNPLEPAYVVYRDGRPATVYFAGNDIEYPAGDCEIAEEIVRKT